MERMQEAIIRRLMMWVTGWSSVIVRLRVIIFVWVATICFHLYHPQRIASQDIRETAGIADTLSSAGEGRYRGSEIIFLCGR